jgi:hypothetical protein
MIEEILCDVRRQIRSIVRLCEEFDDRYIRAKFTNQNDFKTQKAILSNSLLYFGRPEYIGARYYFIYSAT